jgi:serine phosphatase RsbU (regulator of sigma subunit)/anti-sigma regulatory factor (Ser/Thr protein kinase)
MEDRVVQMKAAPEARLVEEYAGVEFPPDFECVAAVVSRLLGFCGAQGISSEICAQVELAVVEGINNAIEHGCAEAPDARVRLRWNWIGEVLEVRIYDPGEFVPGSVEAVLPDDILAEGGRGGFLMATLMDSVEHHMKDGQHCLVLRKCVGDKPTYLPREIESATLLRDMTAELSTCYETLSALFRFSEELATAPTFDVFVGNVLTRLLDLLSAHETNVRLAQPDGRLKLSCARFREELDPEPESRSSGYMTLVPVQEQTIEGVVFGNGAERTVEDCSAVPRSDPLWRPVGVAFVCPLFFQGKVLGVLTVVRLKELPFFSAGQISLIRTIAEYLGIARTTMLLQQQRQEEQRAIRELEIAAEIQQSLVPRSFPTNPKARVFGVSQAAFKVGGDYLDALPVGDGDFLIAIADVMGKGMPAALLATILRTSLRARLDLADDPGMLLTEINRQISPDLARLDSFITAQVAFFSHDSHELLFASAGHCPILKYASGDKLGEQFTGGGVPLGVLEGEHYTTHRVSVAPGDRFVFLTDGIYEAESPAGQPLGWDRIVAEIPKMWIGTPNAFCGRVLDFVRNFTDGAEASDDRTLLTLECF